MSLPESCPPGATPSKIDKLDVGSDEVCNAAGCNPAGNAADVLEQPWWDNGWVPFPPLNYTDRDVLWRHRRWLERPQIRSMLKSIDYRIKEWPQRFGRKKHQYRENACLMAMSEFEQASEFCRCSTIGSSKGRFKSGRCGVWKVCPYCGHKKRMVILSKFLPVFKRGKWWFLTISPTEMCNLNILTGQCLIDWWEACRFTLDTLIKSGFIKGAFLLETISIHAYWPVPRALPHVHVVLLADSITKTTVDELKRVFASYHGQWWHPKKRCWMEPDVPRPIWSVASTRTYSIRQQFDFASILSYLCNPVNLAAAYVQDWPKVAGSRRDAIKFNENVIEAINAWCDATHHRWGHRYMAALQHAHADFTGIKKSTREKKHFRQLVKDMLEECRLKRMMEFDPDDLGTPVEFEGDPPEDE